MSFNGSGTFLRVRNWVSDAAAGIKIRADYHDQEDDNLAAGLSMCLTKDGQQTPVADIKMGGKKLIGLADPINPQDALTLNYLQTQPLVITGNDAQGRLRWTGSQTDATAASANPLGLVFTQADLFFGVRRQVTSGAVPRWVWNNAADGSGTDVMTLTEAGALTVFAGITSGQNFIGSSTTAVLATTGAGTILLRPNGAGSATGQVSIDSGGNVAAAGAFTGTTQFVSSTVAAVLACTGAGNVYLRPNGPGSTSGEMRVSSAGQLICASSVTGTSFEGGHFNLGANTGIQVRANYTCKNGISVAGGGFGSNVFNMLWNSAAMVLFVDNTNLGTINTTSDYRIKRNVEVLPSMWERVKALRPVTYVQAEFTPPMSDATAEAQPEEGANQPAPEPVFREDDIERWGFVAHEAQDTLIQTAASGHKDMQDGVQGLQWAPILAATVRALQEAMARIEALEGTPA